MAHVVLGPRFSSTHKACKAWLPLLLLAALWVQRLPLGLRAYSLGFRAYSSLPSSRRIRAYNAGGLNPHRFHVLRSFSVISAKRSVKGQLFRVVPQRGSQPLKPTPLNPIGLRV